MAGVLFEDIFDVKDIDTDGKKFDKGKINIILLIAYFGLLLWVVWLHLVSARPSRGVRHLKQSP